MCNVRKQLNVFKSKEMEAEWIDAQDVFSVLCYVNSDSMWYDESDNSTKIK